MMIVDQMTRKRNYWIFLASVAIVIVANYIMVRHNLTLQEFDAQVINQAGRQRMLSQRIAKLIFLNTAGHISPDSLGYSSNELELWSNEWEKSHLQLISGTSRFTDTPQKLDSLYDILNPFLKKMTNATRKIRIGRDIDSEIILLEAIGVSERNFLMVMEQIVQEYQSVAEGKLERTMTASLWLSILSLIILIGQFVFIILPLFRNLDLSNQRLTVSNSKLLDFAQIASHNFRAPVGNLKMLLQLYLKSDDEADRSTLIEKVAISTDKLSSTMDVLTDSLKVRSGEGGTIETLSLDSIYQETALQFEAMIIESGASLKSDFSKLPTIRYNKIYLESIFQNLISNALKYRNPERKLELTVESYERAGKKYLVFSDNGLGINLERHGDKIFGLNKVFHRHPDAKGLGLFMTRTQIEAMGGTIAVKSEVDRGTTFTITFSNDRSNER